jgi:hypothetical protein
MLQYIKQFQFLTLESQNLLKYYEEYKQLKEIQGKPSTLINSGEWLFQRNAWFSRSKSQGKMKFENNPMELTD